MKELVKQLHELSGCSLADCNKAIEFCKDIDIAYEFLRLKSQPVARCLISDDIRTKLTDSDYLEIAIENRSRGIVYNCGGGIGRRYLYEWRFIAS